MALKTSKIPWFKGFLLLPLFEGEAGRGFLAK
jgi:hypothetical protein